MDYHRCARAARVALLLLLACSGASRGAFILIDGAPGYAAGVGGYKGSGGGSVNSSGTATGWATKYDASGTSLGRRPLRWDAAGGGELPALGTAPSGLSDSVVLGINAAGTMSGGANKYDVAGIDKGQRAVRWENSTPAALTPAVGAAQELGGLGTNSAGQSFSYADGINAAGTIAGHVKKYDASHADKGYRAVVWPSGSVTPAELATLGTDPSGVTQSYTTAINDSGAMVGYAAKWGAGGASLGYRAVRWAGPASPAVELDNLGTTPSGVATAYALLINSMGTAAGYSDTSDTSGTYRGPRAVRWDAGSTTAIVLDSLGTNSSGVYGTNTPYDINDAGTIVGQVAKYDVNGVAKGGRPVRWGAGQTAIEELELLGLGAGGIATGTARAVDDSEAAVGWVYKYDASGTNLGPRAVYWRPDGSVVELQTLIDPASGWVTLSDALGISPTGAWITGTGTFDPDGPGGQASYERMFLMQIPEPSGMGAVVLALVVAQLGRSRRATHATPPALSSGVTSHR